MKKKFVSMVLAVMAAIWFTSPAVAAAAAKGGQDIYPALKKEFGYRNFSRIKVVPSYTSISGRGSYVFGYFHITYIKSDTYKVEMDVRDRDNIEIFDIRKDGDALELQYGYRRYPYHGGSRKDIVAEVTVYAPELSEVSLSGQSTMTVSGGAFAGKNLNITMSGTSSLDGLSGKWDNVVLNLLGCARIGNLVIEAAAVDASLSGTAQISGASSVNAGNSKLKMLGCSSLSLLSFGSRSIGAALSGASVLNACKVNADSMDLTMLGSASCKVSGDMKTISAEISGAAELSISGSGDELAASVIGSAKLEARKFTVGTADISASGASSSEITVTKKLVTKTLGYASVDYYGHPAEVINRTSNVKGH